MQILGVIPARGGSKGVQRKNIRLLCGKPLLAYTAGVALESQSLARVILSTEDEEIAEVGRQYGLETPFMRPVELAQDDTPMLPVVQHAVTSLEARGIYFDAVCLLQPTNPLRLAEDIDGCINLFIQANATAAFTTLPVPPKHNPHWVYFQDAQGLLYLSTGELNPVTQRQSLPPAFHREGSVYVVQRDVLMKQQSFYGQRVVGYPIPPERSVNIDTLEDWADAEFRLCGNTLQDNPSAPRF
jgi:CMP-N-acetylneuraminic acid synthetase